MQGKELSKHLWDHLRIRPCAENVQMSVWQWPPGAVRETHEASKARGRENTSWAMLGEHSPNLKLENQSFWEVFK